MTARYNIYYVEHTDHGGQANILKTRWFKSLLVQKYVPSTDSRTHTASHF